MTDVLANAVWHSLTGAHRGFADGEGLARRYDPDVSVFHAFEDPTPAAWNDLAAVATVGIVVLFRESPVPEPPTGWKVLSAGEGHQMVRKSRTADVAKLPADATTRTLTDDDVPAMVDLVARTEPGPFRPRTNELGGYIGIFHDDALVAMAGQRFHPPGYVEVSVVCTDPGARRRGLRVDRHEPRGRCDRGDRRDADAACRRHERLGSRRLRADRLRDRAHVHVHRVPSAATAPLMRASRRPCQRAVASAASSGTDRLRDTQLAP